MDNYIILIFFVKYKDLNLNMNMKIEINELSALINLLFDCPSNFFIKLDFWD